MGRTNTVRVPLCRPSCKTAALFALFILTAAFSLTARPSLALADCPAVTDFGQNEAVAASTAHSSGWTQAVFVTLYPDGTSESQIRMVHDDTVNTMVSDHPSWHKDERLTWFVQMPVYVRELSDKSHYSGTDAV